MTANELATLLGAAVTGGLALWRAIHADKVATRVEAKADAAAGATKDSLSLGNTAFQALRDQNTTHAAAIAENKATIFALETRLTTLEHLVRELSSGGKSP